MPQARQPLRRLRPALAALLLALVTAPLAAESRKAEIVMPPGSGGLSDGERQELVEALERSRSELERLAAAAVGADWSWKPAADRWSVGEVVEHLALTEQALFETVTEALEGEEDPDWPRVDAAVDLQGLIASVGDRSRTPQAPDRLVPRGEASRDEILALFAERRTRTLDLVHRTEAPLKRFTSESPGGKMTAHQWLGLIAAHHLRHNRQIAEVLAAREERGSAAPGS